MIKHLLKLMWNRKKSASLLLVEIFLSFLVLFGIFSFAYYKYSALSEPIGFDYKNIWNIDISWKGEKPDVIRTKLKELIPILKNQNELTHISVCNRHSKPYSGSMWRTNYKSEFGTDVYTAINQLDDNMAALMNFKVVEGRWFNKSDDAQNINPVVIDKKFRDEYFKTEGVVGKTFFNTDKDGNKLNEHKVVGVIDDYKYQGEFEKHYSTVITRMNIENEKTDIERQSQILIKVKPGTPVEFEEKLVKLITNYSSGWEVNIQLIEEKRDAVIKKHFTEIVVPASIAFFLLLNVGFGLMGVLWYSINRRKSEIGLRRALGATGKSIYEQIIVEALLLGTFAIAVGIAFAIQLPILKIFDAELIIYFISIATSAVFLYCLVTVCSFYPGLLASKIHPVEALHNE